MYVYVFVCVWHRDIPRQQALYHSTGNSNIPNTLIGNHDDDQQQQQQEKERDATSNLRIGVLRSERFQLLYFKSGLFSISGFKYNTTTANER